MSEKFEEDIRKWYESRTTNLAYLDLAKVNKPGVVDLANNISVLFDRVSLLSKISLKHFYLLEEENRVFRKEIEKLRTSIAGLEKELSNNRPITRSETRNLILSALKQPKTVEKETLKITEELKTNVRQVEKFLQELKGLIGG